VATKGRRQPPERLWRTCRSRDGVPERLAIESLDGQVVICKVFVNTVPRFEIRRKGPDGKFPATPTAVYPDGDAAKAAANKLPLTP
jgi:hypothetical protein